MPGMSHEPALKEFRVAVLIADGTEQSELQRPVQALRDAGARIDLLSPGGRTVRCFNHLEPGDTIQATRALEEASAAQYDGLLLPGGALGADRLRGDANALKFARAFQEEEKPIAAICHAPWILISAGLARGRTLTSYFTVADDIRNAGGKWVDRTAECDRNWVTSRGPDDLPEFCREMIGLFARSTPPVIQVAESA